MKTFESAFETVKSLVADFKVKDQYYLSAKYSEAEVREDYINKFFVALGWGVRHKYQKKKLKLLKMNKILTQNRNIAIM